MSPSTLDCGILQRVFVAYGTMGGLKLRELRQTLSFGWNVIKAEPRLPLAILAGDASRLTLASACPALLFASRGNSQIVPGERMAARTARDMILQRALGAKLRVLLGVVLFLPAALTCATVAITPRIATCILWRERMSVVTVSLERIPGRRGKTPCIVHVRRDWLKVRRITADAIAAEVIEHEARWNWTDQELVHVAMG